MLDPDEKIDVAAAFGVSETQVERDHLISHVLMAISDLKLPLTFFGGTALARTHIADPSDGARLSEDIDLYSPERREVARVLDRDLPARLRREFPGVTWQPDLSSVRSVEPGQLVSREGLRLRIQLLDSVGSHHDLQRWPTELRPVELRYRDTPGVTSLRVPTIRAFAAMKTIAWADRHTARDLYDLDGLSRLDVLDGETDALVRAAAGWGVGSYLFTKPPADWSAQLEHQTGSTLTAWEALMNVRNAYATALGWERHDDRGAHIDLF